MKRLDGRTILITRPEREAREWARGVERLGGRAVIHPCIRTEPVDDPETRAALRSALADADWLVLTSNRGATALAAIHAGPLPPGVRIAAVGPSTCREAERVLGRVSLVGTGGARDLARDLLAEVKGSARVVAAVAEQAGRDLEDVLEPAGVAVTRLVVYRTVPLATGGPIDLGGVDTVLLASPSAVEGFLGRASPRSGVHIVTIGPATSAAARRAGLFVSAEAAHPGLDAILEAIP